MKISSDTKTVGFYYSLDKKSWQLIRLFKMTTQHRSGWDHTQCPLAKNVRGLRGLILTKQSISDFDWGSELVASETPPVS